MNTPIDPVKLPPQLQPDLSPGGSQQAADHPSPSSVYQQAQLAADVDVIEPVWVDQVDRIFGAYGDDPRALAEQFALLKSDYIEKRYGKQLKQPGKG